MQDTPGVLGVLWCGSAARGEADRHSDLDFLALVSGETRWRESFAVLGTPAEAFYNPAAQLRHDVRDGDASTLFMLAEGRVMTPHPVLSELQTAARERLHAGRPPEPLTPFTRHVLVDAVWEARATQDTPLHALVALDTTRRLVRALYAQRGWWDTKPRQWLPDLSGRDPAASDLLSRVLTATRDAERQAALEALAVRVTADLNWVESATDPAPVPPHP
ncbi:nucleotidyltransferase domain-containing protein [Deinococcus aquiradiocola]|uniref:Nucleotidyltransferase domain-containing protein n=1 Tax=Deinococcus aquiradiocola TaxID=393059 RepID=A0A917P6D2_9DEIO|nr:nucleotidyltransferase domain-containing protein [Deinococcus aquiradiocola]GGJ63758.1 hypothetical protein GCM10008939_04570 [Deinococcus aquiradiocola]